MFLGRLRDARACFAKVLKTTPRNVLALYGMAQIATMEGRFEEAERTYKHVIEINPKMTNAAMAVNFVHVDTFCSNAPHRSPTTFT